VTIPSPRLDDLPSAPRRSLGSPVFPSTWEPFLGRIVILNEVVARDSALGEFSWRDRRHLIRLVVRAESCGVRRLAAAVCRSGSPERAPRKSIRGLPLNQEREKGPDSPRSKLRGKTAAAGRRTPQVPIDIPRLAANHSPRRIARIDVRNATLPHAQLIRMLPIVFACVEAQGFSPAKKTAREARFHCAAPSAACIRVCSGGSARSAEANSTKAKAQCPLAEFSGA